MTSSACVNVMHNAVSCREAGIPVGRWCEPCRRSWCPGPIVSELAATMPTDPTGVDCWEAWEGVAL